MKLMAGTAMGKDKKQRILFGAVTVFTLVFFYAFMYSDILITTSFGINFWDVLFSGDIFRFYEACHSDVDTAAYHIFNTPDYDFLIYIIFAIWNLPLWIARKAVHVNIWESALAIAWAKTVILVFTALTVRALTDICKTLSVDEQGRKDAVLLFLTSSILFMSVFVTSQYDIIYLFFMLKAFDNYLKGDMRRFTAWMAVAVPVKSLVGIFVSGAFAVQGEKCASNLPAHRGAVSTVAFASVFVSDGGRKWRESRQHSCDIRAEARVPQAGDSDIPAGGHCALHYLLCPEGTAGRKKGWNQQCAHCVLVLCAVFHLVQYQSVLVYSSAAVSMHSDCTECGQKVSEHDSRNHHLDLLCRYVCVADSMVL